MTQDAQICFDLYFNPELNHFLPIAYIVELENNTLQYVQKKATTETLKSFSISNPDDYNKLLEIENLLKPETLFKKYNAHKKNTISLIEMMKDKVVAKVIHQYISSKLHLFLEISTQKKVPIAVNINREIPFCNQQISFSEVALSSKLFFQKKENLILYTLQLANQKVTFYPSQKEVTPLLNTPGWAVVDKVLYRLEEINANKLNPFLKKKTIEIEEKNSRLYFQTFIKDVLNKVEIEAEGFDLVQKNNLTKCAIVPAFYFTKDVYYLDILFEYQDVTFHFSDKRKFLSSMIVEDEIKIIQTKRNYEAEAFFLEKLNNFGIELNEYGYFGFDQDVHKFQNIQRLIETKQDLEEAGFCIENLEADDKNLATHFGTISIQKEEKEDWFDLQIQIKCGEFSFPFSKIITNIKQKNPFYSLPDGTFFLIPHEWFEQYRPLVEFGKIDEKSILIKKSQYVFLENIAASTDVVIAKKEIHFAPSSNLKASLRDYQTEGVKWLLNHQQNHLGACLADDMGLGKTLQTLAVLQFTKDQLQVQEAPQSIDLFSDVTPVAPPLKALIVTPSSLVFNWKNESKKFTPSLKSIVYTGSDRKKIVSKLHLYDLVFTSYSIISKDIALLKKMDFRYLILDESHYIKNKNSKIFEAINQVQTQNKISLSGTPIENSLDDLWSQMQFINPDLLGSYAFFANYFKLPIQKNQDPKAISELKKLVQPYILRRTKEQVAKDLPPVTEQVFYTEMAPDQKTLYETEKSIARNYLLGAEDEKPANKLHVLNTLMKLRQLANHPFLVDQSYANQSGKFEDVTQYMDTLVRSQHKILVFSSFVQHLALYTRWCQKEQIDYCLLTGETATENREMQVNEFQNNPLKQVFFISLKAGSVGLNLTQASFVLLLDPWWNPFAENQAIARAHRIGQTKHVNVVRFIAKDSIEEKILSLQQKKKAISDAIIDINTIPEDIHDNLEYILG